MTISEALRRERLATGHPLDIADVCAALNLDPYDQADRVVTLPARWLWIKRWLR